MLQTRNFLPGIHCDARVGLNLHLRHSPAKHKRDYISMTMSDTDTNRLNMELDLQSLFGLDRHRCTHGLRPRIWTHIRGRYWSAKIDDISL
jgi:hypothetical protein